MIVMARDADYAALLVMLEGKRVLIWTCNTCARFCNVGGKVYAEELASRLSSDGVTITGMVSSSACCFLRNSRMMNDASDGTHDTVLALCCDMGSMNASVVTRADVINPIRTYGTGYLDEEGVPHLVTVSDGKVSDEPLDMLTVRDNTYTGQY